MEKKETRSEVMELRIENLKNLYQTVDRIIGELPAAIPDKVKDSLKEQLLGDSELKEFMEALEHHRPPRILMAGRTGIGKSSLINALCGSYTAEVSDVESCTSDARIYRCEEQGRVLMEVMDTRGIAEAGAADRGEQAEQQLMEDIKKFSPDAVMLLLSCVRRDASMEEDLRFLQKVRLAYYKQNYVDLPVIVVLNYADEVPPARMKDPESYPEKKKKLIQEIEKRYRRLIEEQDIRISELIAVSSLIDWKTEDGEEISVQEIKELTAEGKQQLRPAFDGRYQIEELRKKMEEVLTDYEARMGLRLAMRLEEISVRLGRQIVRIFSAVSGTVAAVPIPFSDIYILLALQSGMVMLIAALSGREISRRSAQEFILSMGGIGGAGLVFRTGARQALKLVNLIVPGAGSAVNTAVAAAGTNAIGEAAIKYYLEK